MEEAMQECPAEVVSEHPDGLENDVIEALRTVYDPEIPVNIFELGLIYKLAVDVNGKVAIDMTLTSPMCPVAETLPPEVQDRVASVEGVSEANVEITWDPPWSMEKMSEAAKLELGLI